MVPAAPALARDSCPDHSANSRISASFVLAEIPLPLRYDVTTALRPLDHSPFPFLPVLPLCDLARPVPTTLPLPLRLRIHTAFGPLVLCLVRCGLPPLRSMLPRCVLVIIPRTPAAPAFSPGG